MNEITKIHLGRQAFTVSVDAYKALQDYLRAIKRHMGDTDEAVEEVELRMAELLTERGIRGDKVILLKDVDYLKEQLGKPGDFGDAEEETEREETAGQKRLFRDTKHGMIAGVAAGLAVYFGVKPPVVRILFVVVLLSAFGGLFNLSLTGGFWAITLLYIILWMIIPKANTGSERLQMQGKPVTVDAIKDVVERADVKEAATRIQQTAEKGVHAAGKVVNRVLKAVLVVMGLGLMLAGITALLGLTAISVYWGLNHDLVPAGIFPVGASEVALVVLALVALALIALFFIITGQAVVKRKWPLPGWSLGALVAIFLTSIAIGGALAADAAPKVSQRYDAAQQTYTRSLPEFHKLEVLGNFQSNVRYEESVNRAVIVKHRGAADLSEMITKVADGTLTVDSRTLTESMECRKLCLFHTPSIEVVIQGPKLQEVTADIGGSQFNLPNLSNQTLKVRAKGSTVGIPNFMSDGFKAVLGTDDVWTLTFAGGDKVPNSYQSVTLYEDTANISAQNVDLTFDGVCGSEAQFDTGPYLYLESAFQKVTINGTVAETLQDLQTLQTQPGMSPYKCVSVSDVYYR